MDNWWIKFWENHGDRISFSILALLLAFILYYLIPEAQGEAKAIIIGVAMNFFNKTRGKIEEKEEE